ncbi:MAG: SAM-dependent methyltransferase [Balneola sp.]|nr:SAM-dependent methyltransferase [Balneola sp.]
MSLELRAPHNDRLSLELPVETAQLRTPFNRSIYAEDGRPFSIERNIVQLVENKQSFDTLAQLSNHISITAQLYETLWRRRSISLLSGEDFSLNEEKKLLIDWTGPTRGDTILDVGCSTAFYARNLQDFEPSSQTVALDLSFPMLQKARQKAIKDKVDLFLLQADARQIPFYNDTFDIIAMGGTLNEVSNTAQVLTEIRRVLRPNGRFFIMYLLKSNHWLGRIAQKSSSLAGLHFWTYKESKKLFNGAGFTINRIKTKGIVAFALLS